MEELNQILTGWSGFKYEGLDNHKNAKSDYLKRLIEMDNEKLFKETKDMIWLSAYAANNHRSDYHWQVDACYDLLKLRGKESIYNKAFKQVESSI